MDRADLIASRQAMHHLANAIAQYVAEADVDGQDLSTAPAPEWQESLAILKKSIRPHTSPPTATASGQSGLARKVRALAHQWHFGDNRLSQLVSLCGHVLLHM